MGRTILEREDELAALGSAARDAGAAAGSVVLIYGEAGIGKSSLVEAIRGVLPAEGRLLVGYCDDLATPRVLGPLRDLIGSVGTALTQALERGDRGAVLEALRHELGWARHPTVLAIEDVHWADEATLDVLRYLVRRIAQLPLVLVLTYRDDELGTDHPLRQLLGLASRVQQVRRLHLARLTVSAVRRLSAAANVNAYVDADEVFAVTSGNPYFVAEVLAAGDLAAVPLTIAEAVRARLARLDPATREILERLAVVPSAVQPWLIHALVPAGPVALAPGGAPRGPGRRHRHHPPLWTDGCSGGVGSRGAPGSGSPSATGARPAPGSRPTGGGAAVAAPRYRELHHQRPCRGDAGRPATGGRTVARR